MLRRVPLTFLPQLPVSGLMSQGPEPAPKVACFPGVCTPAWSWRRLLGSCFGPRAPPPSDALSLTPRVGAVLIELALPLWMEP